MNRARGTAAISLTKPLTPCCAQQVAGQGRGRPNQNWAWGCG